MNSELSHCCLLLRFGLLSVLGICSLTLYMTFSWMIFFPLFWTHLSLSSNLFHFRNSGFLLEWCVESTPCLITRRTVPWVISPLLLKHSQVIPSVRSCTVGYIQREDAVDSCPGLGFKQRTQLTFSPAWRRLSAQPPATRRLVTLAVADLLLVP